MSQVRYVGRPQLCPSAARPANASVLQCLVVSTADSRRDMLSASAAGAGWTTVVCADAGRAHVAVRRLTFQFALIDLGCRNTTPPGFAELCQTIAAARGILLCVCGHENQPQEEIWARQMGSWLYLPGVHDQADVSSLCTQAREVVDRHTGFGPASARL